MPIARTPNFRTRLAALTTVAACAVSLTGCTDSYDVTDVGRIGVSVDASGDPVLMVLLCDVGRPDVLLVEGRKPSDPDTKQNVQRGEWTADRQFNGVQSLSLTRPGPLWKVQRSPGDLTPDVLLIAEGGTVEDHTSVLGQVSFTPGDLAELEPDQVLTDAKTLSVAAFGSYRCRD